MLFINKSKNMEERTKFRGLDAVSVVVIVCFMLGVFIFPLTLVVSVRQATRLQGLIKWTWEYNLTGAPIKSSDHKGSTIKCDTSHRDYDLCAINGPILVDPNTLMVHEMGPTNSSMLVKTRPYPRKMDPQAMENVKELVITSLSPRLSCRVTHKSPALLISTGGYNGNFFHEFNDAILPLFITINSFFPDLDVVIVMVNWKDWWVRKYANLLPHLSLHPVLNLDNQTATHCFPSALVGLTFHNHMSVDPTLMLSHPKTLSDFQAFLKKAYYNHQKSIVGKGCDFMRPRFILINRKGKVGRVILNLKEVIKVVEEVGFQAIVFEPENYHNLAHSYNLIYSSHAMLGVHGAAITHMLFLRRGAFLGEILPIGLDWPSSAYFENPSKGLGLEYMKYKIGYQESSLSQKYGPNELVIKDPSAHVSGNWSRARVYLKQNLTVDISRFRGFLIEAFVKSKRFMVETECLH